MAKEITNLCKKMHKKIWKRHSSCPLKVQDPRQEHTGMSALQGRQRPNPKDKEGLKIMKALIREEVCGMPSLQISDLGSNIQCFSKIQTEKKNYRLFLNDYNTFLYYFLYIEIRGGEVILFSQLKLQMRKVVLVGAFLRSSKIGAAFKSFPWTRN